MRYIVERRNEEHNPWTRSHNVDGVFTSVKKAIKALEKHGANLVEYRIVQYRAPKVVRSFPAKTFRGRV